MAKMSDDLLAAILTEPLTQFEGRDVLRAAIEIPGAAGGLRDAMKFAPVELHTDQKVYVLMETTVGKIRFDPIKDTEAYCRVHVLAVEEGGATFVDPDFAKEHLQEARDRIRVLKEKAQGITQITEGVGTEHVGPGGEDEDAEDG